MKVDFMNPWCNDISEAAQALINAVNGGDEQAEGDFNEITITADRNSTVDSIVADYRAQSEARRQAYLDSPAGKAATAKAAEDLRKLQETHDALVVQLSTLDFADDVAVLAWLAAYQDPSDHMGVEKDVSAVVATFKSHGYESNVNLGDDFIEGDRDNNTRYLIGQALACLESEVGAIHQVFHSFHERWKAKFLPQAA